MSKVTRSYLIVAALGGVSACAASPPRTAAPSTVRDSARQVDAGDELAVETHGSGLSPDVIRRAVLERLEEVNRCHARGLAIDPGAGGAVVVRFVIGGDGRVATAEVSRSTHTLPQTVTCIVETVREWRFPPPQGGGEVTVNYPFVMVGADPGETGDDPSAPPLGAEERAHFEAVARAASAGDLHATHDALESLARDFPRSRMLPHARLALAELLYAQRDFAAARDAYRAVTDDTGIAPGLRGYARYKLAWALHSLDDHDPALSSLLAAASDVSAPTSSTSRALARAISREAELFIGAAAAGSPPANAIAASRRVAADEAGQRALLARLATWYRAHQREADAVALERAAASAPPGAAPPAAPKA